MVAVLLTRPRAASDSLAEELKHHGYDSVIEPLLVIEPRPTPRPHIEGLAAVMITSGNALDMGQGLEALFGSPCFCVGPRSAAKACAAGFRDVHSATRNGIELVTLMLRTLHRPVGEAFAILHICGEDIASGAQDELARLGHSVIAWPVYAARPAARLGGPTVDLLRQGKIDAVTVFSVRTAQTLIALLQDSALQACCARLGAIGLSEAVIKVLKPLPWKTLTAAAVPTEDGVIERLKQICPVPQGGR